MKNLVTLIAVLTIFSFTSVLANTTPESLISTEGVEVTTMENVLLFSSAKYDAISKNLEFDTKEEISVIQIFNKDGQLEFQLPVLSNKVKINRNLFGSGIFKLGFILEGESDIRFTEVTID